MKKCIRLIIGLVLVSVLFLSACAGPKSAQSLTTGKSAATLNSASPESTTLPKAQGATVAVTQPETSKTSNSSTVPATDHIGGKVKLVNSSTISIESPEGKVTAILTNSSTKFTANEQSSTLAIVAAGKSIEVNGQKQTDGSWLAAQITISDAPPAPPTQGSTQTKIPQASNQSQNSKPADGQSGSNQYTLEQAMSDNAQLSTIAFSGLAFITGSAGVDTFFPPGKVADFFGFQYMRDVDTAGYGHNTTFLSRVANNVLYILNDSQKAKLIALAKEQAPLYVNFAYNRIPISNAFRRNLEGTMPTGSAGLNIRAVSAYTAGLYKTDADLSYNRAVVVGQIINSFTTEQKAYLAKMQFNNYASWPDIAEDQTFKKSMNNNEFVAVMTYASELFSWYKGSLDADVYFCPERHGTYFGGFYMKDYAAMNNPDYFISTATTGDKGQEFLNILNTQQRALITGIIDEQRSALAEIATIRTTVSTELRKAMTGATLDKVMVYTLIKRYGELDGQMSALYATRFAAVNKTLTDAQKTALIKLRDLNVVPQGAYLFSTPVAMPVIPNTDFMFAVGNVPVNAGRTTAPASFGAADKPK